MVHIVHSPSLRDARRSFPRHVQGKKGWSIQRKLSYHLLHVTRGRTYNQTNPHWNFPMTSISVLYSTLFTHHAPSDRSSSSTTERQTQLTLSPIMSRMSKAQKLMLDATRTPVEPTPLMKLVRLPIIDSVSRLKNGDGSVVLSRSVKSLEMRYYPKNSSNGVK